MYKLLLKVEQFNYNFNSPNRTIISSKQAIDMNQNQLGRVDNFTAVQIEGNIHLYKLYKNEGKEISEDSKVNLSAKIEVKSQVVFLSKMLRSQCQLFLKRLSQRKENIEAIEQINKCSQKDSIYTNLIVFSKNIFISQEVYNLVASQFQGLPFYINEVVYIQSKECNERDIRIINQDESSMTPQLMVYHQRWIEIPTCINCLQKIEYELTGIPPQIFEVKSNNKNAQCIACQIVDGKLKNIQTHCQDCQSPQDNWICLVCQKIGCGRYKNGDAFKHFQIDGHIITMDLATQRVWNYLQDCFSHRVIQLEKQEVMLKFPDYTHNKSDIRYEQSLEGAFWEYCSVVSQELERQRNFYQRQKIEEQERYEKQAGRVSSILDELERQLIEKHQSLKKMNKRFKKNQKKLAQSKQKCKDDRDTLKNYEQLLKQQCKQPTPENIDEKSPKIQEKLKIVSDLQDEISAVLVKLTQ